MLGVVALGLIGAAYTLWYEDLKLNVDVSTGTLDVDWSLHAVDNDATPNSQEVVGVYNTTIPANSPHTWAEFIAEGGAYPAAKYIHGCAATISDWDAAEYANDVDDDNLLDLDLTNLYPYAGCKFDIDIHSSGTVPIHLALVSVSDNTGGANIGYVLDPSLSPADLGRCTAILNAVFSADYGLISWDHDASSSTPNVPVQLHVGEEVRCRIILYLDQDSAEGVTNANFMAVFKGHQWNETPLP